MRRGQQRRPRPATHFDAQSEGVTFLANCFITLERGTSYNRLTTKSPKPVQRWRRRHNALMTAGGGHETDAVKTGTEVAKGES
jgi:hypothetical protein